MPRRPASFLPGVVLPLALACTTTADPTECPPGSHLEDDGLCHLDDDTGAGPTDGDGGSDGGSGDGGSGDGGSGDGGSEEYIPPPLEHGDPILFLGTQELGFFEHVDAEVIDEDWGILVGQGGFTIASLHDGSIELQYNAERGYFVGVADDRAWVGTKYAGAYEVDLGDPTNPRVNRRLANSGVAHMDLDFDGEFILLSELASGARLIDDASLADIADFPVQNARGAALGDGIALICDEVDDQAQLVLFDLSTPSSPVELDRVDLRSVCHDVSVQGDKVVAALGGNGVSVFRIDDGTLVDRGRVSLPGTTTGVDIDGDVAWTGSWEVVGMVWIGDGSTPVSIGHEEVSESAMGIGAGHGKAMVADWFHATAMERVEGVGGPELVAPDRVYLANGQTADERMELWNNGAFDLDIQLTVTNGEISLDQSALVLTPGQRSTVLIDPGSMNTGGQIALTTNDPDEASATVRVDISISALGAPHPDFELQGFAWPEGEVANYRLTDFTGEVVFLAYWAEY